MVRNNNVKGFKGFRKNRKGVTLTYYVCVWFGIIIVSWLLVRDECATFTSTFWNTVIKVSEGGASPVAIVWDLVTGAFSASNLASTLAVMGLIFGGVLITAWLGGGNWGILYLIPLLLVFAVLHLYVLPTTCVFYSTQVPIEIRFVYTGAIIFLTILTAISFIRGGT
jgi:hypothetical protein